MVAPGEPNLFIVPHIGIRWLIIGLEEIDRTGLQLTVQAISGAYCSAIKHFPVQGQPGFSNELTVQVKKLTMNAGVSCEPV